MPEQYFGSYTKLVPPLVIDGELYSMAVKFSRSPTNQTAPVRILSGQVVSSSELTGSRRRIVCKRGIQNSSYTLVPGGGSQPFEIVYPCQSGGNICPTSERDRVNNFANAMNYDGPDLGQRLRPGDVLVLEEGDVTKRYTITETLAFEQAPDEVDWQGRDPLPTVQYVTMDNYEVQMIAGPGGFSFADAAPFDDTGAYDDGAAELTRKIFNDDERSYEEDADLGTDEFWFSPDTGVFYFGEIDTTTVEVFYWQTGYEEMEASALQKVVIECLEEAEPAGIDGTSDELATSSEFYLEEFSEVFFLEYGACVLEYRKTLQASSRVVGIAVDIDGQDITDAFQRSTDDGTVASVAFTEYAPDPWGIFRVRRVGDQVYFEQAYDGNFEIIKQFTVNFTSGFLSVGTVDKAKFYVFAKAADDYVRTRSLGRLGIDEAAQARRTTTGAESYRQYTTVNKASTEDIEEITLIRTDVDGEVSMVSRGSLAGGKRDSYFATEGEFYFYPEANGDRIRISYAAPSASPDKPGIPPQQEGIEVANFATKEEGSGTPGESTSNVSENRGNWHDVVIYHDPHGDGETVPGQTFAGERGAFASSQLPPSFDYDVRDGEDDWASIPTADRLWYAPEGILLLKQSFVDGIDGNLCVRATFTASGGKCGTFLNAAGIDADQINELVDAVASIRDLWVSVGSIGGGVAISGITSDIGPGPTAWDCGNGGRQSVRAYGTYGRSWTQFAEDGVPNPAWFTFSGGVPPPVYRGTNQSFSFMDADWRDTRLCASFAGTTNGDTIQEGMFGWSVYPYGDGLSGSRSFAGSPLAEEVFFSGFGSFRFLAPGISIDKRLMRLLRGATCLEAKARVRFSNFSSYSWRRWRRRVDGVTVEESRIINGVETFGEALGTLGVTSGTVGFSLVGRRRITGEITSWDGVTMEYLDGEFVGYPGEIVGGNVESDTWAIIDVTNVVQSLISDRDSDVIDYYMWPSRAGVEAGADAGELSAYVSSLLPTGSSSVAYSGDPEEEIVIEEVSGEYHEWDSLDVSNVWARFDIPGTRLNGQWLPLFMPPQAPGEV